MVGVRTAGSNLTCYRTASVFLLLFIIVGLISPSTETTSYEESANVVAILNQIDDTSHHRNLQQEWISNSTSNTDNDVDQRTVLVIRILEESEDTDTSNLHHTQLNTILFNGNTTYLTTTTHSGITLNRTGVSVSEQFSQCSMGKISLVPLSTHANGHIWDIVIDSSSNALITDRSDRSQWISASASTAFNLGYLTNDNNYNEDRTPGLREMADHVIVVLPLTYPNADLEFLASAEVNNSISVFDASLTNSLSMYMHELGHNIHLQHSSSGKNSELVYGDRTGYMGTSEGSSHYPLKCYNAAQHWQMNWYTSHRISLLPQFYGRNQKWTGRLQVNAFVDAKKLEQDSNHIVLLQIDANTYLQFNRAKSYNVGTSMLMNEVVVIRDLVTHTQLLKGMNMTNYETTATYEYESSNTNPNNNATIKTKVYIQLCDIIIHNNDTYDDSNIDYAIIAIGLNAKNDDSTTLCQSNFVTGTTYTGSGIPIYLTNSTTNHGGPKILDLDNILTKVYELNVLLLILIGCTIVFVTGWTIKLLFLCLIHYCCCGCKCIPGCGDSTATSTTNDDENSITEEPTSFQPQQQPTNIIPQVLPKERQMPKRGNRSLFRWFFPTSQINNNVTRQQREDTESTETTPSQSSAALPVATIVQIY